ncbi:MAG: hypothetical protein DSY80_06305 [Desulfocapsa sp.]|nr:MAG: hypothetical protein DSY80_06305 [Desulfocapsa sp.]
MPNTTLSILAQLGQRLRQARILKKETQEDLGTRIGVSRQVIARMEKGVPGTQLDNWLKVSDYLDLLSTWKDVMNIREDPFEKFDREKRLEQELRKKRVRRRKV